MKYLSLIILLFIIYTDIQAQREFLWSDQATLRTVRPRSVEKVRVIGDSLTVSEQLKGFLENFKWVNHIIIECKNITSVPIEAYKFNKLYKIEFDNCPNINVRSVLQSVKKHEEDIYSIGFRNMDFTGKEFTNEDALRFLEMFSFVNVTNINYEALFDALNFNLNPRFSNLGYLYFENCGMDSLHSNIVHLHNLRSLSLPKNKLKYLPENLPGKLKNLDISFNKFKALPEKTIGNLKRLEFLNIECNKLKREEILRLCNLNRFHEDKDFDQLSSLKFSCNESIDFNSLLELSTLLKPVAYYRTASSVYENDYSPGQPDCTACNKYQFQEIKNELYGNWKVVLGKIEDGNVFQGQFDMSFDKDHITIKTTDPTISGQYNYEISKFVDEDFFRITLIGYSREILVKIEDHKLKAFIPMSGKLVLFTFERR